MKKEKICSLATAQVLKAIGYNKLAQFVYATDFRYKGKHISFEEELDLKAEGKGNQIEQIPFGDIVCINNFNKENSDDSCSAPTIDEAAEWLRDNWKIYISVEPEYSKYYKKTIYWAIGWYFDDKDECYRKLLLIFKQDSYEKAMDYAIRQAAEYIQQL